MSDSPKKLLRQQLAKFVPDPRTLRALEQTIAVAETLAPDVILEVTNSAASAQATATQALGEIQSTSQDAAILAMAAEVKANLAIESLTQLAQDTAIGLSAVDQKATQALQEIQPVIKDALLLAAIAENKAGQALALLNGLADTVNYLALAPPPKEAKRKRYGAFYDTTTQTAAAINTAYPITINTTDITNGVYIGSPTSRVYVDEKGVYNFQFSLQVKNTSGGSHNIYIWSRINGVDQTNSAGKILLQGNNAEAIAGWNYVYSMNAGDYFELVWSTDDTSVQILTLPAAAPAPGAPAVILTVTDNIS